MNAFRDDMREWETAVGHEGRRLWRALKTYVPGARNVMPLPLPQFSNNLVTFFKSSTVMFQRELEQARRQGVQGHGTRKGVAKSAGGARRDGAQGRGGYGGCSSGAYAGGKGSKDEDRRDEGGKVDTGAAYQSEDRERGAGTL